MQPARPNTSVYRRTNEQLGKAVEHPLDVGHTSALRSNLGANMPNLPEPSAKIETGDFDRFTDFVRRIVSVPHFEIKSRLDAEKEAKRTSKAFASRASAVQPKRPN
jgi:hypothetical protein